MTDKIAAHVLADVHADNAAQVPGLLGQAESVIASVTADGAYDGGLTDAAAAARQRHPMPDVVVPPRASAVQAVDKGDGGSQSPCDHHLRLVEPRGSPDMAERGRMGWPKATGYGRRNQAETAMARYKHLIGPKLRARSLLGQQGEAAIAVAVLNTLIRTAKPISIGSPRQRPVPSETGDTEPMQRDRTATCSRLPGTAAWPGGERPATRHGREPRRRSAGSSR